MAKAISQFFADLHFPLRNIRWSWGARSDDIVLLRTWQDEHAFQQRTVTVLREPAAHQITDSLGLDERIIQLSSLWGGGVAGYTVIVEVKDKTARPREIKGYREDVVFAIERLEVREDGSIAAVLSDMVSVATIRQHALTHRTEAGVGPFPVDGALRSGLSTDTYQQKIPAIRAWLVEVCHRRGTVTYSDVMNRFDLTFYPLRNAMSRLGHDCRAAEEPVITAVIVDKDTGRCSEGLAAEFGVANDVAERERCYAHWSAALPPSAAEDSEQVHRPAPAAPTPPSDFEHRAARFAQVEVRPEQRAFRNEVFRVCGGRCVVSGCAVPEALEAAHILGRDWREGHNAASDGLLLRRDLHSLYDRGVLRISEEGQVELGPDLEARSYYGEFHGKAAAGWQRKGAGV